MNLQGERSPVMRERIVLIGREGSATAILYHALVRDFDVHVVIEQRPSTIQLLRSRIRRLGLWQVFGQLLFQILIAKPMGMLSRARRAEILLEHGASDAPIPGGTTIVRSVNGPATWELIRSLSPRAVVVNCARILSKKAISAIGVPILNTHVGITPMYRGVHGAYWALTQGDPQHCGVTVHMVDEGVDTGDILHQDVITTTTKDNFTTYPVIQMAVGSKLLVKAQHDVVAGTATPRRVEGESKRWYHPTLWVYLVHRVRRGVR